MAHSRFCRICKDFHDLNEAWPERCAGHFAPQSAGAGEARFYVQSDSIAPFVSMADGKPYDSKSRYRADLRARGLTEVGNDSQSKAPQPRDMGAERAVRREAIRQTYRQLGG
jgi:hypothetical protein